ncbi:MAG: SPOR domain-containing protein [Bacteroidales bacterium]|nr:SPOR domain-containing protein [Bacteroidales bacterium]
MARDITGYIREMLFRHDCVIIPGFGAFIGNFFPARADRREGLFHPPSRKITFNRHLTGNDGLLIGHISSALGAGYGEARDIVLEWADDLRRKIIAGNPVPIEHLGTFSLNYEGAIIFDPDTTVNYLLSSYGLSAYHRQPMPGYDVRKRALEKRREPSVNQPSVRSLLTRAAVIIPILVALALVPFNDHLFKGNIEESTLNPLARAELEFNRAQIDAGTTAIITAGETVTAESVTTDPSGTEKSAVPGRTDAEKPAGYDPAVSERPVQPSPAVTEATVRQPVSRPSHAVVVEEYRYLLIIGSFQGEDNALTMVESLRRQGFDPEVAGGPDGFLRVSAQSYATLDEAIAELGKARKNYPGAWVCKSR